METSNTRFAALVTVAEQLLDLHEDDLHTFCDTDALARAWDETNEAWTFSEDELVQAFNEAS